MVGTSTETMGGIATVEKGYIDAGLFDRVPVVHVVTHSDGSKVRKALLALSGVLASARHAISSRSAVFHIHMSSRASTWRKLQIIRILRAFGKPYILHLHGSEFMEFYERECNRREQRLVRSIFDGAALVLALSPEWESNIRTFSPNARIEVFPNGVPVQERLAVREVGYSSPRLLFLGRLGKRKGVYDLLSAIAALAKTYPELRLVAAGDGEIDQARTKAEDLGIAHMVEFPGWIGANSKATLLRESGIFVLPSHAEGLPMSLLEAMAAGLPSICSTVGGIPQAVEHDSEGLLIEAGNVEQLTAALDRLLADAQLRDRLGKRAHERAFKEFSVASRVERLVEIYKDFSVPEYDHESES